MLVLDARFQSAIDGLDEILAVKTRLETHDGAAEHALQNFAPPGADPKGLGVRPRNVPEGEDRRPRKPLPDHRRKQREVIVLHHHDRILAARLIDHRVGESLVDLAIGLPVGLAKHRPHVRHVA